MATSHCNFAGCAHMRIINGNPDCSILTKPCWDDVGNCKFFVTKAQAKLDREAVEERVRESGVLGRDGTYMQRFVRAKRVEDEDGDAHTEVYPDIVAWLEWLQSRGIITLDRVNNYKARHPKEVYA